MGKFRDQQCEAGEDDAYSICSVCIFVLLYIYMCVCVCTNGGKSLVLHLLMYV